MVFGILNTTRDISKLSQILKLRVTILKYHPCMTSIYTKYQQILQYESLEEFISLNHESLNLGPLYSTDRDLFNYNLNSKSESLHN